MPINILTTMKGNRTPNQIKSETPNILNGKRRKIRNNKSSIVSNNTNENSVEEVVLPPVENLTLTENDKLKKIRMFKGNFKISYEGIDDLDEYIHTKKYERGKELANKMKVMLKDKLKEKVT